MMRQLSLHVVGVGHPNKRGGDRRFEILLCAPGEAVHLALEPKNPADPQAVAIFSGRGVQIGYLTAERAPWIGAMMRDGRDIQAIFQEGRAAGAVIRIGLDGAVPILPVPKSPREASPAREDDADFWPDYLPPDD